jgi:phage baseplate assembly protein W
LTDTADTTDTTDTRRDDPAASDGPLARSRSSVTLDADLTAGSATTTDTTLALVGRGWAFPLSVDGSGSIALTDGTDVAAAIRMVIMTAPGERPMRPEFGCAIWDHVYASINSATLGQMAHAVRSALARWEPRIDVDQVVVSPDPTRDAAVTISVDYRLRSSNDRRNLVFPFYVIPEGGHR